MASNRIYVSFMLFNVRIVNMQHLWEPSREYLGKPQDKPSWFTTCVVPKTRANWWEEPALAPCWTAYSELLQKSGMSPQHVTEWPIRDGDLPPEPGKQPAEWAKGHWVLGGSTTSAIKVEIVQAGNVVPLPAKIGVKPGDFVALGLTAAIKQNNPRALKHYCNTVLFVGPGEEIAVGGGVSGAELMAQAQAQGLQVAGFSHSPGFGGGMQSSGFPAGPQGGPGGPAMGGAPMGNPGFTQGPNTGMPGGAAPSSPTLTTTFPSNGPAPGGPAMGGQPPFPGS